MDWNSLANVITRLSIEPFGMGVPLDDMLMGAGIWAASWLVLLALRATVRRAAASGAESGALSALLGAAATSHAGTLALVALYPALAYLAEGTRAMPYLHAALLAVAAAYGARVTLAVFERFARSSLVERGQDRRGDETTYSIVMMVARAAVFVVAGLFVLANFGVEITPVLASLGIGGIAVAFALQNILADIFASVSIYFDRPFRIGDLVTIGADTGRVIRIGVKSTRVRALDGEELVISNKEIANTRVRNYSSLERRRAVFAFALSRETPRERLRDIPALVREALESVEGASYDRAHLVGLKPGSYEYEAAYHVEPGDMRTLMDAKESFLIAFDAALAREGLSLA